LLNFEEKNLKKSIFNEEAIQANFSITRNSAFKHYEEEEEEKKEKKVLFDVGSLSREDKSPKLTRIQFDGWKEVWIDGKIYAYEFIQLNEYDRVLRFCYNLNTRAYSTYNPETKDYLRYKPKNLDLLFTRNNELLIYRKDTVFQKNKAMDKIDNFDVLFTHQSCNVKMIQNITGRLELNPLIYRGKLSYILNPQPDDFPKFTLNLDAEQFVLGIRIQS
jgi:hypothetical protein